MNDNETKAVKLCVVSILFMMGIWIFFGLKHHSSGYEFQALSEYNTIPEYSGL